MQNPKSKQSLKAPLGRRIFNIFVYLFALAGFGIIAAWAVFKLGLTNNKGGVDENYRYLLSVSEMSLHVVPSEPATFVVPARNAVIIKLNRKD